MYYYYYPFLPLTSHHHMHVDLWGCFHSQYFFLLTSLAFPRFARAEGETRNQVKSIGGKSNIWRARIPG